MMTTMTTMTTMMIPCALTRSRTHARTHRSQVVGIGAVAMLMKTDVRTSASMLRRNLRHMRGWLEEASSATSAEKKAIEEGAETGLRGKAGITEEQAAKKKS